MTMMTIAKKKRSIQISGSNGVVRLLLEVLAIIPASRFPLHDSHDWRKMHWYTVTLVSS